MKTGDVFHDITGKMVSNPIKVELESKLRAESQFGRSAAAICLRLRPQPFAP
jgi:hypothetical protein